MSVFLLTQLRDWASASGGQVCGPGSRLPTGLMLARPPQAGTRHLVRGLLGELERDPAPLPVPIRGCSTGRLHSLRTVPAARGLSQNTLLVVLAITRRETGGAAVSQGPLTAPRAELALESRPWDSEAVPPSGPTTGCPFFRSAPLSSHPSPPLGRGAGLMLQPLWSSWPWVLQHLTCNLRGQQIPGNVRHHFIFC